MALVERLAILIDANAQGATREFNRLGTEARKTDTQLTGMQRTAGALKGALGAIGITAAVAGLARFADASIEAASNLEEVRQKSEQVFEGSFGQIEKFAESSADSLGLSTRAALEFASAFGNLFTSAGFNEREAAQYSETFTRLAADLASFNNISVDEAFRKLQSGLAGEAEPLRQVGVFLSAAKVEAEAYASGIAETGEELSEAQKIQARYNIILRETEKAQGDVERTADSLANTQRRLAATTENLQAQLGDNLAPAKAEFLGFLNDATAGISSLDQQIRDGSNDRASLFEGFFKGPALMLPQTIRTVIEEIAGLGDGVDKTKQKVEGYTPIVSDAESATADLGRAAIEAAQGADEGAGSVDGFAKNTAYLRDMAAEAESAVDGLREAIEDMRTPVLDVREAERNFAEAVDDASAALNDNGKTLDINTEKGRANQAALDDIADSAFNTLNAYAENGAGAADLSRKTQEMRDKLIEAAIRFGMTEDQADAYADSLGLIPRNVSTSIFLNNYNAVMAQAAAVRSALNIPDQYVNVVVNELRTQSLGSGLYAHKRASGGPVGPMPYMVGEQGPEIMVPRGGGTVYNAPKTAAMMREASGGDGSTYTINVYTADPKRAASEVTSKLRQLSYLMGV